MLGDMAPHVVFQKPLNRKALATSLAWEVQLGILDGKDIISNLRKRSARCNLVRVLPFHMVQELAPGGKESSAGWTTHLVWECSRLFLSQNFWPHQLFLTVAPHMLFEFGDCGDNHFTTCGSRIAERARLHWLSLSISSSSFFIIICPTCPLTMQGFLPFQWICMIVEVQEEVLKPSSQSLVIGKLSLRQVLTPQHSKITSAGTRQLNNQRLIEYPI